MLIVHDIEEKYKRDLNIIKTEHLKAFSLNIFETKNVHISKKLLFLDKNFFH